MQERQRRLTGVDEMMLSLSAEGLTRDEISAGLAKVYGAEVPKQTNCMRRRRSGAQRGGALLRAAAEAGAGVVRFSQVTWAG